MFRHSVILIYYNRKRYNPKFYDFKSIISLKPEIIIRFNDDPLKPDAHKEYFHSYNHYLTPLDSIVFESVQLFINHICLHRDRIYALKKQLY